MTRYVCHVVRDEQEAVIVVDDSVATAADRRAAEQEHGREMLPETLTGDRFAIIEQTVHRLVGNLDSVRVIDAE